MFYCALDGSGLKLAWRLRGTTNVILGDGCCLGRGGFTRSRQGMLAVGLWLVGRGGKRVCSTLAAASGQVEGQSAL
jgi:hypothetical protein